VNKLLKTIGFLFIFFIIGSIVAGFFVFKWVQSLPIPDFESFNERKVAQSTKIYDRTGEKLLYDIHKDIKRTVIPYEDLSRHIKNATVAIEDSGFYQHSGISITGILRSIIVNLKSSGKKEQGGSTITQQLIKNSLLTTEKLYTRKIKEIILSLKIEKVLSKEEILTLYLNEIPYGGSIYGIEEASQSFFGKNAKDLTLAESVYLAVLPNAPTYYSPHGAHRDELEERKTSTLQNMLKMGFITEEEFNQANEEQVTFLARPEKGIEAPHFVMFIKSYLEEKYGKDLVEQGGLKITTTLNLELQKEAEKTVEEYVKENKEKFNAKNAGLVGIDPKTGQILVMVGSRNYFDEEYDGKFNVTLAKRQPGSSFKPFVYATAFKKGYTPETVVFDLETEFNSSCNPDGTPKEGFSEEDECYMPGNYDNIFRGPVTLRNALAQSINIPAVKTLYLSGIQDSLNTAEKLGITTLTNPLRYGLTLVLGGGEVTLLEMTGAYSVFANDGIKNPTTGILKIEDSRGNVIEKFANRQNIILDKKTTRNITDILSDEDSRAPAFGQHSYLYFPDREVAVKTGTTNDYRDAWIIGYTPNFALGVWAGNNDNTPMEKKVAGFIVAPLWNSFFKKVFENLPKEDFPEMELPQEQGPQGIKPILRGYWQGGEVYFIDKISNKLATEFTPEETREEKILTQVHNILYWVDKNNPTGEKPKNPEKDSQFYLWEEPVRKWLEKQDIKEETLDNIPKEYDDVHKLEYIPTIKIISPAPNTVIQRNSILNIIMEINGHFPIEQTDLFINNYYLGLATTNSNTFIFDLKNIKLDSQTNYLKIITRDKMKNSKEILVPLILEDY